ncbi:hypothetical protein B9Z55_000537 [Caenorhabditis nigoni]|uniref:Uncharacterized protein n=1 Tax=Caenorhabditis nigoni TaxID=1611254 RepID=A0A2G5VTH1_9PELO|nr:hypothetical protein B9Z55_000537 [Caenorhabditis nigoni]
MAENGPDLAQKDAEKATNKPKMCQRCVKTDQRSTVTTNKSAIPCAPPSQPHQIPLNSLVRSSSNDGTNG